ncbi:MAG TPA: UDP-N-acetylglucosamine 2-epimerase [Dyadobacter sp.]|jgi:UDP-hydrolysing UDP-N-acetyl-D-glucosamine 2-epimerase|nr:UDP-N-acetylglucosamine 2-epimerase [Dyadobacter sp.]
MKRNICVVITARASYSRVKTVLTAILEHPDFVLTLVVTGSALSEKFGSVEHQIISDGFLIHARFSNVLESCSESDSAKTVALAMIDLSTYFSIHKPDFVLTIADRFETTATAFTALSMNIPLIHLQGGEVSGNIDDKVRNAITQFADIHFVATENAKQRVLQMGVNPEKVFNTGCPSVDIVFDVLQNPMLDFDPFSKYGGVGNSFDHTNGYLIVMQHSVTNEYLSAGEQIKQTFQAIEKQNLPAFWFWPNADPGTDAIAKQMRSYRERNPCTPVHFFRNMAPADFLKLLKNTKCLVGNSSVGIRESAAMGVPVVNIGNRQMGRERSANVTDTSHQADSILEAIQKQVNHGPYKPDYLYGQGDAGARIVDILATLI